VAVGYLSGGVRPPGMVVLLVVDLLYLVDKFTLGGDTEEPC
jgi:hypothetical protein